MKANIDFPAELGFVLAHVFFVVEVADDSWLTFQVLSGLSCPI